jgi:hypothetical protein
MKLRIAMFALFACTLAAAQQSVPAALLQIASVDIFAFGGVGFSGKTSTGEAEFKTILKQPPAKALADFESLYATGNPQAKAYALAGIRRLAPARFIGLRRSLAGSNIKVEIEQGCIVSEQSLRDIAADLAARKYDAIMRQRGI